MAFITAGDIFGKQKARRYKAGGKGKQIRYFSDLEPGDYVDMSTEPYFYNWMTVSDVGKYYEDFFEDFSMEKYRQMISRMELTEDMKAKKLSSGMMAKLKIAVTMARKARLYLLDEPLNGIDLLARDQIMKSILEAIDPDVTLVVSMSHFFQVIMLSAYTQTFLRVRDSVVFGRVVTQNNIFKLVHPCVGKHQGRVIFYHHRSRGNNVVSFRLKEILE